jgi:hypothetical protein
MYCRKTYFKLDDPYFLNVQALSSFLSSRLQEILKQTGDLVTYVDSRCGFWMFSFSIVTIIFLNTSNLQSVLNNVYFCWDKSLPLFYYSHRYWLVALFLSFGNAEWKI